MARVVYVVGGYIAMRIVVSHLTRMQPGYICVAGIEPESGAHIRPTQRGRLPRALLRSEGGPFDIGGLVDLSDVEPVGVAPEIEDHAFHHWAARYLETLTPDAFWKLNQQVAQITLGAIFGPDLEVTGRSLSLAPGQGRASLGCLIPTRQPRLALQGASLRMLVTDGVTDLSLPVTDLRFYESDHKTIRLRAVANISQRLAAGARAILAVGVSRPFQKDDDSQPRHWLQVNNIHLEDQPIWQEISW